MLTFSATGLPDGLNMDEFSGVISGTPAEDAIQGEPYPVTVTVDDGSGAAATQTFNWTVSDSTLAVQANALTQQQGAGDQTFTVATFTDPDQNRQATDYSATIDWGDGQTSQGWIDAAADGGYTVSGDHVYLHPGSLTPQVTVTDPAGGATTAATTATVTAAPITMTGGVQYASTPRSSDTRMFAVATFSDADGYTSSGDYQATISWGDGLPPSVGFVDGGAGVFRVCGNYHYTSDGTYTVTATVTDRDGRTATATSTVVVGDVIAGQTSQVQIGPFSNTDPNPSYAATIWWGDGASSVGYVEGGAYSYVAGSHAYAAPGEYAVTASVTDTTSGQTITATSWVDAAPAAVLGYGGTLAATIGQATSSTTPLATLTGSASLATSAVVDWGDGTTSTTNVVHNGGIAELLASHVYVTAGDFGVTMEVYDAAGRLVGAVASAVAAIGQTSVDGPAFVPGNSRYTYIFNVPPTPPDQIDPNPAVTNGNLAAAILNGQGDVVGWMVNATFVNKPAKTTLKLTNWERGNPNNAVALTVIVVQVTVSNLNNGQTFTPATQSSVPLLDPRMVTIDGKKTQGILGKMFFSHPYPLYDTDPKPPHGFAYSAQVTLTGPGDNEGVNHIVVGFVQHAVQTHDEIKFTSGATLVSSLQPTENDKKVYLDSSPDASPYYATDAPVLLKGKSGVISSHDDPQSWLPLVLSDSSFASSMSERVDFTLDVVAGTTYFGNPPKSGLARESTVNWAWDYSGKFAPPAKSSFAPNEKDMAWTPDKDKVVSPEAWVAAPLGMEDVTGPLANDMAHNETWSLLKPKPK